MDLADHQWTLLRPLIPQPPASALGGRPPIDDRAVLDGILWRQRHRAAWSAIPTSYPSFQTCFRRYRRWQRTGIWQAILSTLYQDLEQRCPGFLEEFTHSLPAATTRPLWRAIVMACDNLDWQPSTALLLLAYGLDLASQKSPPSFDHISQTNHFTQNLPPDTVPPAP